MFSKKAVVLLSCVLLGSLLQWVYFCFWRFATTVWQKLQVWLKSKTQIKKKRNSLWGVRTCPLTARWHFRKGSTECVGMTLPRTQRISQQPCFTALYCQKYLRPFFFFSCVFSWVCRCLVVRSSQDFFPFRMLDCTVHPSYNSEP